YVRVAQAEQEPQRCLSENADGAHLLAKVCAELGIAFVTFSSDLVFDGTLGRAYVESDTVNPVSTYGLSKVLAEQRVREASEQALIIRSSAFFGPWDRYNFLYSVLRDLSAGMPVVASDDLLVSPTYVPDLVHETLDLLIDGAHGIWHVANRGEVSWHALAARVARGAELDPSMLKKARAAPRRVTALRSERGHGMPTLDSALERFLRECRVQWRNEANATALARD
ncbi:MAG: sugar nucleotide-binding protein, partial [Pseudomonadota bacterium]|nr:sugar nucleotide-binding protein [Pseudomonadota bacterium]